MGKKLEEKSHLSKSLHFFNPIPNKNWQILFLFPNKSNKPKDIFHNSNIFKSNLENKYANSWPTIFKWQNIKLCIQILGRGKEEVTSTSN